MIALLICGVPSPAPAGEEDAPRLIEQAGDALARQRPREIERLVAADRAAAYEAVDSLLNESGAAVPIRWALADALADAYATAYADTRPQERVATFRSWTEAQRNARTEAVRLKKSALETFGEGRLAETGEKLERALTLFRKVGDKREEGRCLSNLGALAGVTGDGDTALARLDQARGVVRQSGDLSQLIAIENNRAYTLEDRGDLEGARAALEAALPLARSLGDRRGTASLQIMLGSHALNRGDLEEAVRRMTRAATLGREIDDAELEASARASLGAVLRRAGDTREAARQLRRAAEIAGRSGLPLLQADVEMDLAEEARRKRDLAEALRCLERARQAAGRTDSEILKARVDLQDAQMRSAQGRYEETLPLLRAAEERLAGVDAPAIIAEVHGSRAVSLFYLGDYAGAIAELHRGLDAARAASRPDIEAAYRRNLGYFIALLGDSAAGAEQIQEAARLHRATGERIEQAQDLHTIGALRARAGDPGGARAALEQALSAYPRDDMPVQRAEALFDLASLELASGSGRRDAGLSLLQRSREAFEALEDPLGIFDTALLEAEAALETGDTATARASLGRIAAFGRNPSTAEFAWKIRYLEGRLAEEEGNVESATRAYADAVGEVEKVRGVLRPVLWRAAILEDRIAPYRALVRTYIRQGELDKAYAASRLGKARTFTEQLLPVSLDDLPPPSSSIDVSLTPGKTKRLSRLRRALDESEVLLDFFFTENSLLVFVLRPGGLQLRTISAAAGFCTDVAELIDIVRYPGRPGTDEETVRQAWEAAAGRLGTLLFEPLAGDISSAGHLLIVPNGPLHGVPFAALRIGGRYLVESHSITVLPAAELLLSRGRHIPSGATSTLVVGDPASHDEAGRLPGAEEEARRVAALSGPGADLLLGVEARESVLRARAGSADRIHLAAHGRIDRLQPARSYVALAPGDGDDGRLEAGEIASLRLKAGLVVLSGCDTAFDGGIVRDDPPGDERAGLVRAFLATGASEVIAGLWEMEDRAGRTVFPNLYPRLRGGSAAAALATLQQDLIAGRIRNEEGLPLSHPFYWAGLQAYGAGVERPTSTGIARTPPTPDSH